MRTKIPKFHGSLQPDLFIRSFDEEDEVDDDERVTRRTVIRERPWYLKEDNFWHLIEKGLEFEDEPLKYDSKVYKEELAEDIRHSWEPKIWPDRKHRLLTIIVKKKKQSSWEIQCMTRRP